MSTKTVWISDSVWRALPFQTRKDLLRVMPRSRYVGRYVCDVTSDLHALGEGQLADELMEEIADLPRPLRVR